MYSSSNNTNEFEKYSTAPYPPSAPYPSSHHVQFADHHSQFSDQQPFTGIPVSHTDPIRAQPPASWSATLCGCCDDVSNCCITCWCPCITFGQIAEIVDKGSTSCGTSGALYTLINFVTGCACIYSCFYRSKLRQQYHLKETPCNDCLVHCFCEYCALCQEYRELKTRGFDMSLGWHGNMEKQTQGVTMAPIFRQDMNR